MALLLAAICAVCFTGCATKDDTRTFSGPLGGVTFRYPSTLTPKGGIHKLGGDTWLQVFTGAQSVSLEVTFLPTKTGSALDDISVSLNVSSPLGLTSSKPVSPGVVRATQFLAVGDIVAVSRDYDFTSSDSRVMRKTDVAVPLATGTLIVQATAPPDSWPQAQAMQLGILRSLKLAAPQPSAVHLVTYQGEPGFPLTLPAAFKQIWTAPRPAGPWRIMRFHGLDASGRMTTAIDFAWTVNAVPSAAQPHDPAHWRQWATYISRYTLGATHSKALVQHLEPVDDRQQAWCWQYLRPDQRLHAVYYAELADNRMAMVFGYVTGHEWFLRQELLEAIGMSLIDNSAAALASSPSPL